MSPIKNIDNKTVSVPIALYWNTIEVNGNQNFLAIITIIQNIFMCLAEEKNMHTDLNDMRVNDAWIYISGSTIPLKIYIFWTYLLPFDIHMVGSEKPVFWTAVINLNYKKCLH